MTTHSPDAFAVVGKHTPSREVPRFVRGRGRYVDDLGFPGMLLGMFLMGGAFHLLHGWLVEDRRFFGIVIYAVLWPTLVIPEYPLAAYFSNAAKQVVLLVLISLVAGARWRRQRRQT